MKIDKRLPTSSSELLIHTVAITLSPSLLHLVARSYHCRMWGQRGGGGVLTRFSAVTLHKSGILSIVFWRLLVTSSILSLPGRSNSPPMESIHPSSMSYIRGSVRRSCLQCVHSSNGGWGYWKSKCCTVLGSHMDGKPWTMRTQCDRSHGNPVCPLVRTGGGFTALVVGHILI